MRARYAHRIAFSREPTGSPSANRWVGILLLLEHRAVQGSDGAPPANGSVPVQRSNVDEVDGIHSAPAHCDVKIQVVRKHQHITATQDRDRGVSQAQPLEAPIADY